MILLIIICEATCLSSLWRPCAATTSLLGFWLPGFKAGEAGRLALLQIPWRQTSRDRWDTSLTCTMLPSPVMPASRPRIWKSSPVEITLCSPGTRRCRKRLWSQTVFCRQLRRSLVTGESPCLLLPYRRSRSSSSNCTHQANGSRR